MLKLALARLHIPPDAIELIISLFTNRTNKILTHYGLTESYHIKIGVDQGETISPLLWVIYMDPLLTELNTAASSPYIYKTSSLTSLSSQLHNTYSTSHSHLMFMDDSTLISSSQ